MKLNDNNFQEEVLKAVQPVLVDFYATWCGPCQMQAPIIDELEKEYAGKVKVCIVDVDQAQKIAEQYHVSSIPTLIIFKNGQIAERLMSLQQKGVLKEKLDNLIE